MRKEVTASDIHPHADVEILNGELGLATLNGKGRQLILKAVTAVAFHDNRVTTAETALLRTICASLDVPLPPLLAGRRDISE